MDDTVSPINTFGERLSYHDGEPFQAKLLRLTLGAFFDTVAAARGRGRTLGAGASFARMHPQTGTPTPHEVAIRHGRLLEYLSVAWMVVEAAVGIASGILAGSIALIGFGADSVIELFSSAVLLWRLHAGARGQQREPTALTLVGVSFFALAAYVTFGAIRDLALQHRPHASYLGITLAAVAFVAMPLLARAKRRVAASLQSRAMHADSRQSDFCAYLSGILLAGLMLNASFRWWWADPAAALVMVLFMLREGVQAFRGETCCNSTQAPNHRR